MIYHFKGFKEDERCVCTNILNYPHLYQCQIFNNGESPKEKYKGILNETLHKKKECFKYHEDKSWKLQNNYLGSLSRHLIDSC